MKEEKQTDLFKKLIPIAGDVGEENLGLSSQDRTTLINKVEVVFHSAATLDFEADLRSTTNINLLGTRRIIQLCREIKNLKVNRYSEEIFCKDLERFCFVFLMHIYHNLNSFLFRKNFQKFNYSLLFLTQVVNKYKRINKDHFNSCTAVLSIEILYNSVHKREKLQICSK